MARKARFTLPGIPQHLIQRGNNREPCFYAEADYARYLTDLGQAADRNACRVDPELEKRGRQFVSTFNELLDESLPMPGAEHAKAYWHAGRGSSLFGRCVRLGWDDTVSPVRHYHWGLVHTRTAEGMGVHEFWSTDVWTTTRFRSVLETRHAQLP